MSEDEATEPMTEPMEDEDKLKREKEEEKKRIAEKRRRRARGGAQKKRVSHHLENLNLEDDEEGFDIEAIFSNLEKIGEEHSDNALDDILLDEVQKLSEEAVFFQVEEFGKKLADVAVQKMELEAVEHQLDEDHKNLEEKLGVDAVQLHEISAKIQEYKEEALRAKAERLAEFKTKKKNLHAKKKLEEEVYTIKSKYEEKNWEQVELEDAKKALEKEISIMKEILVELQKAKKATSDIQEKIPTVRVTVHEKVKEILEVEEFKDKFALKLLDCQNLLRSHSLSRIETMKEVERRVTTLQKKSMLVTKQQDFGSQIFDCLLAVQELRQLESDIKDMRHQFSTLLQVEVDALHHLLKRVQNDRKKFNEQILEENKQKRMVVEQLKKLNNDFQQVLDKAKGHKKTQKLVQELVEMVLPLYEELGLLIPQLNNMMYEDLIITSHRERLDLAKSEIKVVSTGMEELGQHHDKLLDQLGIAMGQLHQMKEKRHEMQETLAQETERVSALQKQLAKGKGKKKK